MVQVEKQVIVNIDRALLTMHGIYQYKIINIYFPHRQIIAIKSLIFVYNTSAFIVKNSNHL